MDTTTFYLFEKIKNKEDLNLNDVFLVVFLIPVIGILVSYIKDYFSTIFETICNKIPKLNVSKEITIQGVESNVNNRPFIDFPISFLAVNHWLVKNTNFKQYRNINVERNSLSYFDDFIGGKNKEMGLIATNCKNFKIMDDLFITVLDVVNTSEKSQNDTTRKINLTLSSKKKDIQQFINKCIREYNNDNENKNKNKIFHFIYLGDDKFSSNVISDLENNPNYETFEHIVNEHSNMFINDINRLKNLDYYKKTGMKRKKGYLFHGPPGCGKTATVMAMANYDKRHIIEVPMSRVKTNTELENIILKNEINKIKFERNEIIIFFDEIDCGNKAIDKRIKAPKNSPEIIDSNENEKTTETIAEKLISTVMSCEYKEMDELNLGIMLSRFDGIGNYNGLIIIGATNDINKLDPALYRELRLTAIHFDYCRREDIVKIIETYYDSKLNEKELMVIPDRNAKISPAKIKFLLEKYENNKLELIQYLSEYKPNNFN
jgi:hypothetical protein